MSTLTPDGTVPLREYFESQLELRDQALQVQAREYERRLEALNHAHQEAQRVLNTYLPRETWEAWLKEEQKRREKIDAEVAGLRSQVSNMLAEARAAVAANARNLALASVVIAVVVMIANGAFG